MDKGIIDLWADIGSKKYWKRNSFKVYKGRSKNPVLFREVYYPLGNGADKRWPQPGFIGERYFKLPKHERVVVIGQNPGVPSDPADLADDKEMFRLIRRHSRKRSSESLDELFSTMREFMLGTRSGRREWGPIRDVRQYIGLKLENIAYLNLVPLCTLDNKFNLKTLQEPYRRSTKLQIKLLKPDKILFYGKVPHDKFKEWDDDQWNVRYLERIQGNIKVDKGKFAEVRHWLES